MNPEARIRAVFEGVLDDGSPWQHPTYRIRRVNAVKGRCVHVTLGDRYQSAGKPPRWSDLAHELLGPSGPCDSFRLDGWDLYASMKTDAQLDADADAWEQFDSKLGIGNGLHTCEWGDAETEKPAKPKAGGKWEALLETHIRESGATTFARLALLSDAQEAFEKDGKKIRLDNLNVEFKKLLKRGVVAPVEGGDDEFTVIE